VKHKYHTASIDSRRFDDRPNVKREITRAPPQITEMGLSKYGALQSQHPLLREDLPSSMAML
jgi:hypothetical protein